MKIEFSTSGAAFQSEYENDVSNDLCKREEVIRILKRIIAYIDSGNDHGSIMDINGNKIGEWSL